eukprot:TRINITY_DN2832_c0_g1_i1.p1 TRINITY_DN2832_c0_g1~~TRINITY_DN2832_c0_g1_i1.p1  ORF type:complete len:322 (-),score=46.53 TRINITY_DN2832_c0_g1_i1:240-1205(-)
MQTESTATGISDEIIQRMDTLCSELSKSRKKREISPKLAKVDDLKAYKNATTVSLHKASTPGITCLDLHPKDHNQVLTGGIDKTVVLFDRASEKVLETVEGHSKRITDVLFHPSSDTFFSSSQDKTVRLWSNSKSGYQCSSVIKTHTGSVNEMSLHPLEDFLVTCSTDRSWALHDIRTSACLVQKFDHSSEAGFECVSFHPDGLILGTGTGDAGIHIWDIKTQQNVATFEGHKGKVVDLAFSENGYYMATVASDSQVKLWDLRKLKNFQSLSLAEEGVDYSISKIAFDYSGTYLALAGTDLRVFLKKRYLQSIHILVIALW